jgi:hypothetical protein
VIRTALSRRRVPGVSATKTRAGTKVGTCLALHVSVFRRRGPAPPVTRTRSQSQTKQQPAGDGRALLPFVLGTFPFTQVGPHTSYWLLGAAVFVSGMGMDATMMPFGGDATTPDA